MQIYNWIPDTKCKFQIDNFVSVQVSRHDAHVTNVPFKYDKYFAHFKLYRDFLIRISVIVYAFFCSIHLKFICWCTWMWTINDKNKWAKLQNTWHFSAKVVQNAYAFNCTPLNCIFNGSDCTHGTRTLTNAHVFHLKYSLGAKPVYRYSEKICVHNTHTQHNFFENIISMSFSHTLICKNLC